MTAKEFLQRYLNADEEINAKLDQIHKLREMATKTTQVLTPDKIQTGGSQSKMEIIIAKIVDIETEVDAEIGCLHDIKQQVQRVIDTVPNAKQRAVLTRRYINGHTWEKIASDMGLSYWHVVGRLHPAALKEISENFKKVIEGDT